jgi:hypothetical protein
VRALATLAAFFFLLLVSCAPLPGGAPFAEVAYPTEQSRALVFIYRHDELAGARTPTVEVSGQPKMEFHNLGYAWLSLPPGTYRIRAIWPRDTGLQPAEDSFTFEPNRTYYVRLAATKTSTTAAVTGSRVLPIAFAFSGVTSVRIVEREKALKTLPECTSVLRRPAS